MIIFSIKWRKEGVFLPDVDAIPGHLTARPPPFRMILAWRFVAHTDVNVISTTAGAGAGAGAG